MDSDFVPADIVKKIQLIKQEPTKKGIYLIHTDWEWSESELAKMKGKPDCETLLGWKGFSLMVSLGTSPTIWESAALEWCVPLARGVRVAVVVALCRSALEDNGVAEAVADWAKGCWWWLWWWWWVSRAVGKDLRATAIDSILRGGFSSNLSFFCLLSKWAGGSDFVTRFKESTMRGLKSLEHEGVGWPSWTTLLGTRFDGPVKELLHHLRVHF